MTNHTCCTKQRVKRGLWSPEEDEKLLNYIATHGHGCWSTIPRLAGLQRCGKSCRLRWINYLRPDLKRGNFTSHEAALIIELHRVIGNRWAQIARHLPGRTDNEVKNFWNSNIKRKLLAHQSIFSSDPHLTALSSLMYNTNNPNVLMNNNNNNNNHLMMNPNTTTTTTTTTQLHHQMYTPTPPPTLNNNYSHNNNYNFALVPPPSDINVPPPSSPGLPPLPDSCSIINIPSPEQHPIIPNYEDDYDFMQGLELDDEDLDILDSLMMPQISEDMSTNVQPGFPDYSPPSIVQGLQQEDHFLDAIPGFDSGPHYGSGPLHPNHISNIASLMESFAPTPSDCDSFLVGSPGYQASNWGPLL